MQIRLPKPEDLKKKTLLETINQRYSCRRFKQKALNLKEISLLLWAAGGLKIDSLTGATRTIPSAGATNPLEFYLVVGKDSVEEIEEGVYHYIISDHALELTLKGDKRKELMSACLGQDFIAQAPISIVITAIYSRTTWHYGERGVRYVHMEVGNSTQNIHLMAEDLDLGTVIVGAFYDDSVKKVLDLGKDCQPLAVMPVGYPK
jgi:SagB-type dehydrogenase family enzyme